MRLALGAVPSRLSVGFLLTALLVLTAAPPAGAYVYWTNGDSPQPTRVGRANLDATGVSPTFITGASLTGSREGVNALAVDNAHIYWANTSNYVSESIGRANLDGSGVDQSFISGIDGVVSLVVDGAHIYWGRWSSTPGSSAIGRANLDGSGVNESFITGIEGAFSLAVDGEYIYWSNGRYPTVPFSVGRARLDGSGVDPHFIPNAVAGGEVGGLAVHGGQIYWTRNAAGAIGRAASDGSAANPNYITGVQSPAAVAVNGAHLYWSRLGRSIGRVNLDGTGVFEDFICGFNVTNIAADALGPAPVTSPMTCPAHVPPAPKGPSHVSIVTRSARVSSRGVTKIKYACSAGSTACRGKIHLGRKIVIRNRRTGRRRFQGVRVAGRMIGAAPGLTGIVELTLTRSGKRLLRRAKSRRLRVLATATASNNTAHRRITLVGPRRFRP